MVRACALGWRVRQGLGRPARALAAGVVLRLALGALGVLALAGCGGGSRGGQGGGFAPATMFESSSVPGRVGVEAMVWTVRDSDARVPQLLAEHELLSTAELDPVLGEALELWKRNGFRVAIVPTERLRGLLNRLPPWGAVERGFLEPQARWTALAAAEEHADEAAVMLDSGLLALHRGRLRLLARGWPEPTLRAQSGTVEPAMRIEIVPQSADPPEIAQPRPALRDQLRQPGTGPAQALARTAWSEGVTMDRLSLELLVRPGFVVIVAADAPEASWAEGTSGREDVFVAEEITSEEAGGEERAASDAPTLGVVPWPDGADAPTLGERMLTVRHERRASGSNRPGVRFVDRTLVLLGPRLGAGVTAPGIP